MNTITMRVFISGTLIKSLLHHVCESTYVLNNFADNFSGMFKNPNFTQLEKYNTSI